MENEMESSHLYMFVAGMLWGMLSTVVGFYFVTAVGLMP